MDFKSDFNIFVGGMLGTLKGIKVEIVDGEWKSIVKNLQNVEVLNKDQEVTAMAWGDSDESDLILGLANQRVKVFDTEFKGFTTCMDAHLGSGPIIGVGRFNGAVVTAVESGEIKVWAYEEEKSCVINTGGPLEKMKLCPSEISKVATGGKENDLRLWDLETQKNIFMAKNVRHNELEMRVPVWVSDIDFLPTSTKMAVCSKYGYVRLYDPNTTQRRPVCDVHIPERILTAISAVPSKEHHVVVGTGTGHMMMVDLRGKGVVTKRFKGSVGSIRSVACHPTEPYVVSVGLDRFIKIHHLESTKLLFKEFLHSRLNHVLLRRDFFAEKKPSDSSSDIEIIISDEEEEESKMNKLFDDMESIEEPSPKKKRKKRMNS